MKKHSINIKIVCGFFLLFVMNLVVGQNLSSVTENNNVLKNTILNSIKYPTQAVLNDAQGEVYVRFITNENKGIQNARILGVRNDKDLSEAALEAIYNLKDNLDEGVLAKNTVYRLVIDFRIND